MIPERSLLRKEGSREPARATLATEAKTKDCWVHLVRGSSWSFGTRQGRACAYMTLGLQIPFLSEKSPTCQLPRTQIPPLKMHPPLRLGSSVSRWHLSL